MQPLRDLVLVKLSKPDEKTASGILITRKWEAAKAEGEVLAVGKDVTLVKKGDKVRLNPYAVLDAGENAQFIREKDILAHV